MLRYILLYASDAGILCTLAYNVGLSAFAARRYPVPMPLWLPPPELGPHLVRQGSVGAYQEVAPGILVKSRRTVFRADGVVEFSEGVEAIYDVTTIQADKLVVHTSPDQQFAIAEGQVRLLDPIGTLTARKLRVEWKGKTGEAEDVEAISDHALVRAKRVVIEPGKWEAFDAQVSPCNRDIPLFSFRMTRIVLTVGKGGTAFKPSFYVGNRKLGTLPNQRINLDRRTSGVQLPAVLLRGDKVGLSWGRGLMLDDRTSLEIAASTFTKSKPGFDAVWTRSFIEAERSIESIVPKSELSERFSNAWMERITVANPGRENRSVRAPKNALSISTAWNKGANESARDGRGNFAKALEAVYELGGSTPWGARVGQVRFQTIREGNNAFHARLVTGGTAFLSDRPLLPGLDLRVRADGMAYLGNRISGWIRGSAGLAYQPIRQVRIGAAYIWGAESGSRLFDADGLNRYPAAHLRFDANLGPTKVSYLWKYDLSRKELFDREYMFSQIIGCFEPFITYRQVPSDYVFGVRLRSTNIARLLNQRDPKRPENRKAVLSGAPAPVR